MTGESAREEQANDGVVGCTGPVWAPPWVRCLGTAVWVSGPSRRISYLNKQTEALLGRQASDCVGRRCYEVIGLEDASGRAFCRPECPTLCLALGNREIAPVELRVADASNVRSWVKVLTIPVWAPDNSGPWLVHCVLEHERAHRIEEYLARIAARTPKAEITGQSFRRSRLTRRQRQILGLLAQDESLHAIAARLNVSHVTVRNHVQHILTKLGVHSIMEAVACHLLMKDRGDGRFRAGSTRAES